MLMLWKNGLALYTADGLMVRPSLSEEAQCRGTSATQTGAAACRFPLKKLSGEAAGDSD